VSAPGSAMASTYSAARPPSSPLRSSIVRSGAPPAASSNRSGTHGSWKNGMYAERSTCAERGRDASMAAGCGVESEVIVRTCRGAAQRGPTPTAPPQS
jgi:hypothetical protein